MSYLKNPKRLFVGNEWIESASGELDRIINPANEALIGESAVGSMREVELALQAARDAFDNGPWPRLTNQQRADKMQEFYAELEARASDIIRLQIEEAGATVMIAQFAQYGMPMDVFKTFIAEARKREMLESLPVEVVPTMTGGTVLGAGVTARLPVGVVAAITGYNFPFSLNIFKIAPALLMGNTVILKPSPFTPFSALILAEVAEKVGLPRGVLNVITGGIDVGNAMTTDHRVDMVTFTGSDTVGAAILAQSAPTIKRVILELGGKSPLIVRQDANLEQAAMAGLIGFTMQCGQGCGLSTRQLVHNSIREQYVQMVTAMAQHIKLGDPSDPSVGMGPLIRESQRARVERYVGLGLESGAKLMLGGKRPSGFDKGFFFEPTLFNDVDNKSAIAQDEIFGPVGVVVGFDSDEEAIALANDSKFGLGSEIYSADTGKAFEMALQLRTGVTNINGGANKFLATAPFGGFKRSGLGRECGKYGLDSYTEIKAVGYHAG